MSDVGEETLASGIAPRAIVLGCGPAGLAAAAALAHYKVPIQVIGPSYNAQTAARDTRTTAVLAAGG